jgi:hypothetical protein
MTVFYSLYDDGDYRHRMIEYLGDWICEGDISYWAVPGTLSDDDLYL